MGHNGQQHQGGGGTGWKGSYKKGKDNKKNQKKKSDRKYRDHKPKPVPANTSYAVSASTACPAGCRCVSCIVRKGDEEVRLRTNPFGYRSFGRY